MIELTRLQQLKIAQLLDSLVCNVKDAMEHINEGECNCRVCIDVHEAEKLIQDIKFNGDEFQQEVLDKK